MKKKSSNDISKKHWDTYFNAIKKQDWQSARESLDHLSNIERNNPQVYLKLGDIYQRMGDNPHAIVSYHKSAWILKKQGFIQKALALYKIIHRLDPLNEEAIKTSNELLMELESSKMQTTAFPFIVKRAEEAEQKTDAEVGLPLGIEEKAEIVEEERINEVELKPSVGMADMIERTSYSEEAIVTPSQPAMSEQGEIELQPITEMPETLHAEEERASYIPSLFSSLPEDEAWKLIKRVDPRVFLPGDIVVEEGDSGDSIFLLKSGHAKVLSHILGKEIQLAVLSAGDVFGEVAFLTGRPRTASVIALDRLEVIEFNKFLLEEIFDTYPDILKKLDDFYQCRVQDTIEKVKSRIKK